MSNLACDSPTFTRSKNTPDAALIADVDTTTVPDANVATPRVTVAAAVTRPSRRDFHGADTGVVRWTIITPAA